MLYYNLEEFKNNEHIINQEREAILDEYLDIYQAIKIGGLSTEQYNFLKRRLTEIEEYACERKIFAFDACDIVEAVAKTQNLDSSKLKLSPKINSFLNEKIPENFEEFINITKQIGYYEDGINTTLDVIYDDKFLFSINSIVKSEDFEEFYKNIYFENKGACNFVVMNFYNPKFARFYLMRMLDWPNMDKEDEMIRQVLKYLVFGRVYLPNAILKFDDPNSSNETTKGINEEDVLQIDVEIAPEKE